MINSKVYLTDVCGEQVAEVYEAYIGMTYAFDHDYHNAYAYGNNDAVQRVHQNQLTAVAELLGYSTEDVHNAYEEAVAAIMAYWDTPKEFRDVERYES